jgi:hypothetical protein
MLSAYRKESDMTDALPAMTEVELALERWAKEYNQVWECKNPTEEELIHRQNQRSLENASRMFQAIREKMGT